MVACAHLQEYTREQDCNQQGVIRPKAEAQYNLNWIRVKLLIGLPASVRDTATVAAV